MNRRALAGWGLVLGGAGVVVVALAVALPTAGSPTVGGVACGAEILAKHEHVQLTVNGIDPPAQLGHGRDCLYWIHDHDTSGTVHIEGPRSFTPTIESIALVWRATAAGDPAYAPFADAVWGNGSLTVNGRPGLPQMYLHDGDVVAATGAVPHDNLLDHVGLWSASRLAVQR